MFFLSSCLSHAVLLLNFFIKNLEVSKFSCQGLDQSSLKSIDQTDNFPSGTYIVHALFQEYSFCLPL